MGYVTSQKLINYDFPTDIQATLQEWFRSLPWIFSVVFGEASLTKGYSEMLVFFAAWVITEILVSTQGPSPEVSDVDPESLDGKGRHMFSS